MRYSACWVRIIPVLFLFLLFAAPVLAQPDPFEFENAVDLLNSDKPHVRIEGLYKLSEMGDERAIEPIVGLLNDPDDEVGQAVASVLQDFPLEKVWKPLLQRIAEGDEKLLPRYSGALLAVQGEIRTYLHTVASPNPRIRAAVVIAFDGPFLKDQRVRKSVLEALLDAEPIVRAAAILPAIRIAKGDYSTRAMPPQWQIAGGDPWDRPQMAIDEDMNDPEIAMQVRRIRRGNVTIRTIPGAAPAKSIDAVLLSLVISRAFDMDARVRAAFVKYAYLLSDKRAMGAVRAACGDIDAGVRKEAYTALFQREEANLELELAAMKDQSPEVRQTALVYASKFDDARVKDFIAACMTDEDAATRLTACVKIALLKDPARIKTLALAALKDGEAKVRSAAIKALGENGDTKQWLPELEPLLKDGDKDVKQAAAKALVNSRDTAHTDQFIEMIGDADLRKTVLPIIGKIHDPRIAPHLVAMLKEQGGEDANVNDLMTALLRMGPAGDEALLAFANEPGGGEARLMATFLLIFSGNDRVFDKLVEYLHGDDEQAKRLSLYMFLMSHDARHEQAVIEELEKDGIDGEIGASEILVLLSGTQNPTAAKLLVEWAKPGGKFEKRVDNYSRKAALRILANMEDPLAVDFICKRIANKDKDLSSIIQTDYGMSILSRNAGQTSPFGKGVFNDPRIIPIVLKEMTAPIPAPKPAPKGAKKEPRIHPEMAGEMTPFSPDFNKQLAANGWNILTAVTNPKAKDALHAALRDQSPRVRMIAACALGRFDKDAATPELLPLLASKDLFLRRQAAETLASFGDGRALPVLSSLRQRMQGVNYEAHKKIVLAMGRSGAMATPVLMRDIRGSGIGGEFIADMIDALCLTRDPRVPDMLAELARADKGQVTVLALQKLAEMKDARLLELLIASLDFRRGVITGYSARKLAEIGDPCAVEPLRKVLAENNKWLAPMALEALVKLKDPQAIEEALKRFDPEKPDLQSITLLGETRDPRACEPLLALYNKLLTEEEKKPAQESYNYALLGLKNKYSFNDELIAVIAALGKLGDKHAFEPLLDGLHNSLDQETSRYWSPFGEKNEYAMVYIKALGELGDPRAVQSILDALYSYDCDPVVAAEALAKLGDGRAVPGLLRLANSRLMMPYLLMGNDKDNKLDPDRLPKALAQFRDAAGTDALKNGLRTGSWRSRATCSQALAYRGEGWCAWELLPLISDPQPEVRAAAASSLGMLKAENMREGLTALLNDRYPDVRKAAREALQQIDK